ncbi:hypothetical protein [Clostridium perfringens]|uniref:hypothetical protein n=1 Tax=Clostridium perfringens TaxID=1502 RepID=UPI0024BD1CC5|nr:hypothetical protein [Clostridium perfringens]
MDNNLLENRLTSILHDVTDWLKFAEAKNLLIITFNSAWLAFYIKKIFDSSTTNKNLYMVLSSICILALITSFISFIPKMFKSKFIDSFIKRNVGEITCEDNLLFYKDISKYSVEEYFNAFNRDFFDGKLDNEELNYKYEKTIIKQIIAISTIAYEKYYIFNISIVLSIIPNLIILLLFIYDIFAPITINLPKLF